MLPRIVTVAGLSLFALSLAACVVEDHHGYRHGWYDHDGNWHHDRDYDRDREHWRQDRDWR